jgi:cytosine/adenosine deaminase-related metal-dependent hydrolase
MTVANVKGLTGTPGFIDAHSHLRSTSYHEHGVRGLTLEEALLRMTAMTAVNINNDVFVACSELIAKGVTGVQVMFHTFGDADDYLEALDQTVTGIRRSGIRALVVLGTTDSAEFAPPGVEMAGLLPDFSLPTRRLTADEFGDAVSQALTKYPDVTFGVGPVGPQWCTDSLLHSIGEISQQGLRVHSHFAESETQRYWAGDLFSRMAQAKLLGPQTSLAHAVWLTESEMDELCDLGVSLVTCPLSNHLLRAGTANVTAWQAKKIPFGVGLDSADRDQTPMAVATRALSAQDALVALTSGGFAATGINTEGDEVVWSDNTLHTPQSVTINGHQRVVDGILVNNEEVDGARQEIAATMQQDGIARQDRHRILDTVMSQYLTVISGATRES